MRAPRQLPWAIVRLLLQFRESHIDPRKYRGLPELREDTLCLSQMLKDIGVSSAGHRLRIRNAIARLSPASPLAKNENATITATEPKTQDVAERRQVTVMFSDLVGSTALSARMDPEDLREVISAYQKCVAEIVRSLDGFVAKYMGESLYAVTRPHRGSPG